MSGDLWFLGSNASGSLAAALGAELTLVPEVSLDDRWSAGAVVEWWRAQAAVGAPVDSVVVAVWPEAPEPSPVVDLGPERWLATVEAPVAVWFAALAVAADRCGAGGQVVAVVDRPDPRGSAGWGGPAAVADAVEVMTRSLAQAHEPRRVRVNAVTFPTRLVGATKGLGDDAAGRAGGDVATAVSMLLSGWSAGVTANTLRIGGSR